MRILALNPEKRFLDRITLFLHENFKSFDIHLYQESHTKIWRKIVQINPDIVIISFPNENQTNFLNCIDKTSGIEWIIHCSDYKVASEVYYHNVTGYFTNISDMTELKRALECSIDKIKSRKSFLNLLRNKLIYIPTVEGAELIKEDDIIRFEGKERCTKIISSNRNTIISSYNIGYFKNNIKNPFFILIHKSHLINYKHIVQYYREGILIMSDNSKVPISRRKRPFILELLKSSITQ